MLGISLNVLPSSQYSLDCPQLSLIIGEKNKAIQADIIQLDNEWTSLRMKMVPCKDLFFLCLSHALCSVIGQLKISSHQLKIVIGRYHTNPYGRMNVPIVPSQGKYARRPLEERIQFYFLPIVSSWNGIWITPYLSLYCFEWNKGDTIAYLIKFSLLHKRMGIWGHYVDRAAQVLFASIKIWDLFAL